ncbi:MAG: ATP-binding cassette domain-containing protein [Acidimicrobiia bacterium]|nr:ATP-binding cassette domain-containing protein [Acidimicrobiia bacterium]
MDTIVVSGLTKRYGAVTAVDDLSFTVAQGRVTGLLGPNGAGKTTTLRALLGFTHPDAGSATFAGTIYRELEHPTRHVGAVLDTATFHPGRTARDHLEIMAVAAGIDLKRVDDVLAQVDLSDVANRRVKGFSLGMRQRLVLAGALLGDPAVLVLDEPANGLDPDGVHWLRLFLREFASSGRTVLVSSHMLAEVAQTVDDVVIVSKGRAVWQGPLADVVQVDGRTGESLEDAFFALTHTQERSFT